MNPGPVQVAAFTLVTGDDIGAYVIEFRRNQGNTVFPVQQPDPVVPVRADVPTMWIVCVKLQDSRSRALLLCEFAVDAGNDTTPRG